MLSIPVRNDTTTSLVNIIETHTNGHERSVLLYDNDDVIVDNIYNDDDNDGSVSIMCSIISTDSIFMDRLRSVRGSVPWNPMASQWLPVIGHGGSDDDDDDGGGDDDDDDGIDDDGSDDDDDDDDDDGIDDDDDDDDDVDDDDGDDDRRLWIFATKWLVSPTPALPLMLLLLLPPRCSKMLTQSSPN